MPRIKRTAADARWAKEVKERDGHRCKRCLKPYPEKHQGLHAAHIFTRSRKATRTDRDNGVSLCMGCHLWGHANPSEFREWVISWMGEDKYLELERKSKPRG